MTPTIQQSGVDRSKLTELVAGTDLERAWERTQIRDPAKLPLSPSDLIDERLSHLRSLVAVRGPGAGYYERLARDIVTLLRLAALCEEW